MSRVSGPVAILKNVSTGQFCPIIFKPPVVGELGEGGGSLMVVVTGELTSEDQACSSTWPVLLFKPQRQLLLHLILRRGEVRGLGLAGWTCTLW